MSWPPVISPALPNVNAQFNYLGEQWWAQSGNASGISFPAVNTVRAFNTPTDFWGDPPDSTNHDRNRSEMAEVNLRPFGTRIYFSFDVMWEAGGANDADYLTWTQLRQQDNNGSAIIALIQDFKAETTRFSIQYNGSFQNYFTGLPFTRGQVYHWEFDVLIPPWGQSNGIVNVKRDGVTLVNLTGVSIGYATMGTGFYVKQGVYRGNEPGLTTNQAMQFSNLQIVSPYSPAASSMTQTLLTTTSAQPQLFTVPSDWAPVNKAEGIAPGGNGSARTDASNGGKGGAGGGYALRNNLNLVAGKKVGYRLPAGGSGLDAWFNDLNLIADSVGMSGASALGTLTGGQTDSQGGTTAQKYTDTNGSGFPHQCGFYGVVTKQSGVAVTVSWAADFKALNLPAVRFDVQTNTGGSNGALMRVDLTTGSISSATGYGTGTLNGSDIQSLGGGWYRLWLSVTFSSADTGTVINFVADSMINTTGAGDSYTATGQDCFLIGRPAIWYGDMEKPYTATTGAPAYSVLAKAGGNATTSAAGVAPTSGGQGDVVYNGGNGAANATGSGGGGGGAAGPHGAGANASTTTGGSADNATVSGAAANANGNSGIEWDATHGAGSGAGGQTAATGNGFNGGNYGGGASGCGVDAAGVGGTAGQALIAVNYTPGATTGTAAGVGAASGVGRMAIGTTGSAAGTGAASGSAAALAKGAGSAAGVGGASAAGAALAATAGSAPGTGGAAGVGAALAKAAGSAAGTSSATAGGQAAALMAGSAPGVGAASGQGAALAAFAGSASGVGVASGVGAATAAAAGSASGAGAASGDGRMAIPTTGSAPGTGGASGASQASALATGSAAGSGTASGVAAALAAGSGQAAGTGGASAGGAALWATAGSAPGLGAGQGRGAALWAATGQADGVGAAQGVGAALWAAAGQAVGVSTALAEGAALFAAAGLAVGVSGATGVGALGFMATGVAVGIGGAHAVAQILLGVLRSKVISGSSNKVKINGHP